MHRGWRRTGRAGWIVDYAGAGLRDQCVVSPRLSRPISSAYIPFMTAGITSTPYLWSGPNPLKEKVAANGFEIQSRSAAGLGRGLAHPTDRDQSTALSCVTTGPTRLEGQRVPAAKIHLSSPWGASKAEVVAITNLEKRLPSWRISTYLTIPSIFHRTPISSTR